MPRCFSFPFDRSALQLFDAVHLAQLRGDVLDHVGVRVVARVFGHFGVHAVAELLGGVVAHVFGARVDGGAFYDDGDVAAGADRDGVADDADAQEGRVLFVEPEAVVGVVFVVFLQGDGKVNVHGVLDALHAEHVLDIEDADAAQLEKVPGEFRRIADQGRIGDFADLDDVVRDESVAAADELQGYLRLTDAAVAHDEHADAVYVDEDTVHGHALCELDFEPAGELGGEAGGRLLRHEQRDLVAVAGGDHADGGFVVVRVDEAGQVVRCEFIVRGPLLFAVEALHVGGLDVAQDLDAALVEVVVPACELQGGAVDLPGLDISVIGGDLRGQVLKAFFFDEIGDGDLDVVCHGDSFLVCRPGRRVSARVPRRAAARCLYLQYRSNGGGIQLQSV